MSTTNNLVSIITPSYNSARFITETINSVLAQTYPHWEMIIVDDVSPDNANEIIECYARQDDRIKLIKLEKNSGPACARNRAIEEAEGRYIAFLDSDDVWLPQKLEKQINFMHEYNVELCYSSYLTMNEDSRIIGEFKVSKLTVSYKELLKSCIIGNLTAIYDVEKIGKNYMENVGHEDYTLWLKILKKISFAYGIDEPLAQYRISSKSISGNKFKSALWQWNIYRKIEKINFLKSTYYFFLYAYYGLQKYSK